MCQGHVRDMQCSDPNLSVSMICCKRVTHVICDLPSHQPPLLNTDSAEGELTQLVSDQAGRLPSLSLSHVQQICIHVAMLNALNILCIRSFHCCVVLTVHSAGLGLCRYTYDNAL